MAERLEGKEILSIGEEAEYLSFGKRTIYKLVNEEIIPYKKSSLNSDLLEKI